MFKSKLHLFGEVFLISTVWNMGLWEVGNYELPLLQSFWHKEAARLGRSKAKMRMWQSCWGTGELAGPQCGSQACLTRFEKSKQTKILVQFWFVFCLWEFKWSLCLLAARYSQEMSHVTWLLVDKLSPASYWALIPALQHPTCTSPEHPNGSRTNFMLEGGRLENGRWWLQSCSSAHKFCSPLF